ncbi:MAG: PilZ domain-containing protein [Polyangiaceae bacterium]
MRIVHPPGMKPNERRKHPRVTISVDVDFETGSNFYSGKTRDMSEGGVFVESPIFAPVGARIELNLKLFGHHYEVPVEVAWILCDEAGAAIGFGARFLELRRPVRRVIHEFMQAREPMPFELLELEEDEPAVVEPVIDAIAAPRVVVPPPLPVMPPPLPVTPPPLPMQPMPGMGPVPIEMMEAVAVEAEVAMEPVPATVRMLPMEIVHAMESGSSMDIAAPPSPPKPAASGPVALEYCVMEPVAVESTAAEPAAQVPVAQVSVAQVPAAPPLLDRAATPIAVRRRSTLRFARGARSRVESLAVVPPAPPVVPDFETSSGIPSERMVH